MACSDSICMRVYWYVHCLFKQISIDRRIFWDIGMLYFQLKVNYNINKYLICQLIKLRIESIVSSLNQLKNHSHSIYIGNQFNAPMILYRIFLLGGRQKSSFRFFFIYLAKLVSIKTIYPSALYLVLARFTWLKLPYEQNYIYSNELLGVGDDLFPMNEDRCIDVKYSTIQTYVKVKEWTAHAQLFCVTFTSHYPHFVQCWFTV